ncbi:hypothetical protein DL96DRAFT_1615024 [Flagelloscypha sp. PMI_526]|nr:hypothetical protein DL96DRAFT_1615024 [Flagelloscypha sp. PMI_526]
MNRDLPDSAIVGFYHKGFSQIIVNTCLWGNRPTRFYLVLFPFSLRALFRHYVWSRAKLSLGVAAITMFIVTNIYFFVFLRLQTSIVEVMLTNHGNLSNIARLRLAQDGIKGSRVIEALPRLINFILGDSIVVHRAFVIVKMQAFDHPKRVFIFRVTMILLLLGSIGFSVYDGYLSILLGTKSLDFALTGHSNNIPDIAAVALSFFTNVVATIGIAVTTRHQILPSFVIVTPHNDGYNAVSRAFHQVGRVLFLLTETAIIYCVLQFVAIIILAVPATGADGADIATGAYLSALNTLSALYPTLLIIIFSSQSKGEDSFGTGSNNQGLPHERKGRNITHSVTFTSQISGSTLSEEEEWKKARGIYTNSIV